MEQNSRLLKVSAVSSYCLYCCWLQFRDAIQILGEISNIELVFNFYCVSKEYNDTMETFVFQESVLHVV